MDNKYTLPTNAYDIETTTDLSGWTEAPNGYISIKNIMLSEYIMLTQPGAGMMCVVLFHRDPDVVFTNGQINDIMENLRLYGPPVNAEDAESKLLRGAVNVIKQAIGNMGKLNGQLTTVKVSKEAIQALTNTDFVNRLNQLERLCGIPNAIKWSEQEALKNRILKQHKLKLDAELKSKNREENIKNIANIKLYNMAKGRSKKLTKAELQDIYEKALFNATGKKYVFMPASQLDKSYYYRANGIFRSQGCTRDYSITETHIGDSEIILSRRGYGGDLAECLYALFKGMSLREPSLDQDDLLNMIGISASILDVLLYKLGVKPRGDISASCTANDIENAEIIGRKLGFN